MSIPEGLALLRHPFPPGDVNQIPRGGVKLDYVGHAAVTARLLDADPAWTWAPAGVDEHGQPVVARDPQGRPVGLWIHLTVCGVTRLGYGSVDAAKPDAVKELIGDALRNAAMRFGVALDLWHKGDLRTGDRPDDRTAATPPTTRSAAVALTAAQQAAKDAAARVPDAAKPSMKAWWEASGVPRVFADLTDEQAIAVVAAVAAHGVEGPVPF